MKRRERLVHGRPRALGYRHLVAPSLSLVASPNGGAGENDLFGVTTAAGGSTSAVAGYAVRLSGMALI